MPNKTTQSNFFKEEDTDFSTPTLQRQARVVSRSITPSSIQSLQTGDISGISQSVIVTPPGAKKFGNFTDIRIAVEYVNKQGGGIVFVKNGTYKLKNGYLDIPSRVQLIGESREGVILDCGKTNSGLRIMGKNEYTTGTLSVSQGSDTVTGVGTTWLTNIKKGYFIRIGRLIIIIKSVESDTSLTLGNSYVDATQSAVTYVSAEFNIGTVIDNIVVRNPLNEGIIYKYANRYRISNTNAESSVGSFGITVNDSSEGIWDFVTVIFNGGGGMDVNHVSFTSFRTLIGASNGGNGFSFANSSISAIDIIVSNGNASNGLYLDTIDNFAIRSADMLFNGNHGAELTASQYVIFLAGRISGSSDGLRLTLGCDNNTINGLRSYGNNRGVHIVESTSDNNIVIKCQLGGNTTAGLTDVGTTTTKTGNIT